jgi:S1-C subfamily serine protease
LHPSRRTGDILVALDEAPITGADDLIRMLAGDKIARRLEVTILRNGKREMLTLVPEERTRRK